MPSLRCALTAIRARLLQVGGGTLPRRVRERVLGADRSREVVRLRNAEQKADSAVFLREVADTPQLTSCPCFLSFVLVLCPLYCVLVLSSGGGRHRSSPCISDFCLRLGSDGNSSGRLPAVSVPHRCCTRSRTTCSARTSRPIRSSLRLSLAPSGRYTPPLPSSSACYLPRKSRIW